MSEIKFRAWHKEAREYCEGTISNMFRWIDDGQPVILEQYIGVESIDGREIYENDIVKFKSNWDEHIAVVKRDDDKFVLYEELKGDLGVSWCTSLTDFLQGSGCDGYEIIGNKLENYDLYLELLEEEE